MNLLINKGEVDGNQLLTPEDLCRFLQITKRTLYNYRTEKGLQFVDFGRSIRFRPEDVKEFVENHMV